MSLDLAGGQVCQPVLVRVEPRLHVLGLVVHHVAFDGGSEVVLLRDLSVAYQARVDGERAMLRGPARYGEFVSWERAELDSPNYPAHVEHWRRILAGDPATHPVVAALGGHTAGDPVVGTAEHVLDETRTAACLRRARAARCSPGIQLLALQLRTLANSSGVDDLVIGCELSLRHLFRSRVVGPVINTVPL